MSHFGVWVLLPDKFTGCMCEHHLAALVCPVMEPHRIVRGKNGGHWDYYESGDGPTPAADIAPSKAVLTPDGVWHERDFGEHYAHDEYPAADEPEAQWLARFHEIMAQWPDTWGIRLHCHH